MVIIFFAPFVYNYTNKIKTHLSAFITLILLVIFSLSFIKCVYLLIMFTRFPLFFLGMYCTKLSMDKDYEIPKYFVILLLISMIIGIVILKIAFNHPFYLLNYGMYWYPFIMIVPGLCICISKISELIENNNFGKYIFKFLNFVGKNTFELYLVHVFVMGNVKLMIKENKLTHNYKLWLISFIIIIVWTILLKYFVKLIMYIYDKIKKQNNQEI